jgi:predicted enzyme related to lactoylglutathione lyase
MAKGPSNPVVHLELHTGDLARACAFYRRLCGWRVERVAGYRALELARSELGGGIVECDTQRPLWLPYVEVEDIAEVTERALVLGATMMLTPREGPAGWRSVIAAPSGGEIAFWQPKQRYR